MFQNILGVVYVFSLVLDERMIEKKLNMPLEIPNNYSIQRIAISNEKGAEYYFPTHKKGFICL